MKLTNELKSRIDSFFDYISAEELYDVLTNKYHLPDADEIFEDGEYVSSLSWDSDTVIHNYTDIPVEDNVGIMSEHASMKYSLAA